MRRSFYNLIGAPALFCFAFALPVFAADTDVFPGQGSACGPEIGPLQCAINNAQDGDRLLVHPGLYEENLTLSNFVGGDLRIQSTDGALVTTVRGLLDDYGHRVAPVLEVGLDDDHLGEVIIDGLRLENGDSGLSCRGNCITLARNCIFADNYAEHGGGISIVYNLGDESFDPIKFFNVRVEDNIAAFGGGGINIHGYVNVNLEKATVRNNSIQYETGESDVGGGLLAVVQGGHELEIISSVFENNHAYRGGGGLYVRGAGFPSIGAQGKLTMSRTSVLNNQIDKGLGGGAFVQWLKEASITDSHFVGNRVGPPSGAITWSEGGGLALYGGMEQVLLKDTIIRDNEAALKGGGLFLHTFHVNNEGANIDIHRNRIENNRALEGAGAYVLGPDGSSSTLFPADTAVINNVIAQNGNLEDYTGGGLFISAPLRLIHNTIYGNAANEGAGVAVINVTSSPGDLFGVIAMNNVFWANDALNQSVIDILVAASDPLFASYNNFEHLSDAADEITSEGGTVGPSFSLLPGFVNEAQGDFHLRASSKMRNRGTWVVVNNDAEAQFDFDGVDRLLNGSVTTVQPLVDIGAFEYTVNRKEKP